MKKLKIGIAITTYNRPEMFAYSAKRIYEHAKALMAAPNTNIHVKLYAIIDKGALQDDYRPLALKCDTCTKFDGKIEGVEVEFAKERLGISRAKQRCLDVLIDTGCEHVFLLDDDIFPREGHPKAFMDYVIAPFDHGCYSAVGIVPTHEVVKETEVYKICKNYAGILLYLSPNAIQLVKSGLRFNEKLKPYGHEHGDFTGRLNGQLHPYLQPITCFDAPNSVQDFYTFDFDHNWAGEHLPGATFDKKSSMRVEPEDEANIEKYIEENAKILTNG